MPSGCGCMVVYSSNDFFFSWFQTFFSIVLHIWLVLPHPLALGLSHCIHVQVLDLMGIQLFHYAHGGERMISHDVVSNAFAFIVKDVRFHVLCEQTHVHSPLLFQFCV